MKDDTTPVQKNSALLTDTDTSVSTRANQILAHLKTHHH
jgi:hypothetical protein